MKFKPFADRYFDNIADKFEQKIYQSDKGQIRLEIFNRDLHETIPDFASGGLHILDAGGGAGHMALCLAQQGHHILLAEPAAEMLHKAQQKIDAQQLNAHISLLQTPVQTLGQHLPAGQQFDMIVFHAVLEWLLYPQETLAQLMRFLKPGGYLSLAFFNKHSLVMQNIVKGNFDKVLKKHFRGRRKSLTPTNPQQPEDVYQWLTDLDMALLRKTGVRLFHDYVDKSIDKQAGREQLLQLEHEYCHQEPYINLARYIHVIAQKSVM